MEHILITVSKTLYPLSLLYSLDPSFLIFRVLDHCNWGISILWWTSNWIWQSELEFRRYNEKPSNWYWIFGTHYLKENIITCENVQKQTRQAEKKLLHWFPARSLNNCCLYETEYPSLYVKCVYRITWCG